MAIAMYTADEDVLMVENRAWLGIIYPENVRYALALLTPLAFLENRMWHTITSHDCNRYFPNNGKVAIFKEISDVQMNRLCLFYPEINPRLANPEDPKYAHYMTGEIKFSSLAQIIDCTKFGDNLFEIPDYLHDGIEKAQCICQRVYIRYRDLLYGPIVFAPEGERCKPEAYIRSSGAGGQKLLVSVYPLPTQDVLYMTDMNHNFQWFDEDKLGVPLEQVDWSPPQVVVKRILLARRGINSRDAEKVQLVDKYVRELVQLSSLQGPDVLQIEFATIKRAQYMIMNQTKKLQELQSLLDVIPADHPLVKSAIVQEIQHKTEEIRREAEKQAQLQLIELQQRIEQVQAKSISVQNELENVEKYANPLIKKLQQEVEQEKEKLLSIRKHVEQEIQRSVEGVQREAKKRAQSQLEELQQKITHAQAELAEAQKLTEQTEEERTRLQTELASLQEEQKEQLARAHQTLQQDNAIQLHGQEDDLFIDWQGNVLATPINKALTEMALPFWNSYAQKTGLAVPDLRTCFAALLAGLVPALSGPAASLLAHTLAHVLTGKRIWTVPVPLTAVTPLDLFGSIDTTRNMFIPAAGGLADIILQAQQHPQELALVLLEGIDRVPGMPVYVPLLNCYRESQCAESDKMHVSRQINLFHPRALSPEDPYRGLARLSWPRNLLLITTRDDDFHSIMPPQVCEDWLFTKDIFFHHMAKPSAIDAIGTLCVSLDSWQKWLQELQCTEVTLPESLSDIEKEQSMFYKALTVLKAKHVEKIFQQAWPVLDEEEMEQAEGTHVQISDSEIALSDVMPVNQSNNGLDVKDTLSTTLVKKKHKRR